MGAKKWTMDSLFKARHSLSEAELDQAIHSLMPDNIREITKKIDRCEDLTQAEQSALDKWENKNASFM